jgi:hypothetical protein
VNPQFLTAVDDDWGFIQWGPHVISLMMEGSMGLADYQCRQLLHNHYMRINPVLPVPIGLDGLDQVPMMKSLASQFDLEDARAWLKRNFKPAKK